MSGGFLARGGFVQGFFVRGFMSGGFLSGVFCPDTKKIRHSKRKYNNFISKRNSTKKKNEELKGSNEGNEEMFSPEESFNNPVELEQAFNRTHRSYRINGRSRMDVKTFFDQIRQNLIDVVNRKLTNLNSARVQMTAWITFRMEVEDENRSLIGVDRVRLLFNARMMEIFQSSDFKRNRQ